MNLLVAMPSTKRGLAVWALGFAVAGVSIAVLDTVSPALASVVSGCVLLVACGVLLSGLVLGAASLNRRSPRDPVLQQARLRPLPPEPAPQVHAIAYRCVICGRPLTNPKSMRSRVGSTCIRTYGPRFKMVANPKHERWRGLLAAAEADRAAEQAHLNVAHARALKEHAHMMRAWEVERQSPAGQQRKQRRRIAAFRVLLGAVCAPAGTLVGVTVGALLR